MTNTENKAEPQIVHKPIEWTGKSGTQYRYYIWPRGAKIEGTPPGNFLHVKVRENGDLEPVYIAQTDDLNRRLLSQEEQEFLSSNGATQLHIRANYKGEQDRIAEVADLIARWQPVCNYSPRMVAARQK